MSQRANETMCYARQLFCIDLICQCIDQNVFDDLKLRDNRFRILLSTPVLKTMVLTILTVLCAISLYSFMLVCEIEPNWHKESSG